MKTKHYSFILILFIILVLFISGCKKVIDDCPSSDDDIDDIVLPNINNLKLDVYYESSTKDSNYVLSFDEIEDSCYYIISINNKEFEISENKVNINRYITNQASFNIKVTSYNSKDEANSLEAELKSNKYKVPNGLEYNLLEDDTYEVDASNCETSEIAGYVKLPDYYDNKKITKLSQYSFERAYYSSQGGGMKKYEHGNLSTIHVSLPNYLEIIDERAFYDCDALKSIDFPNTLKYIGEASFATCEKINLDNLPNKIEYIGDKAFDYSNLTSFNYSDKLTYVGNYAFNKTPYYDSLDDGLIIYNNVLYSYKGKCPEKLDLNELTNDITIISPDAFASQKTLIEIDIPDSIYSIGFKAFSGCTNLEKINISSNSNITYIGDCAFGGTNKITEFSIPKQMTEIGGGAFGSMKFSKIIIHENIEKINTYAFTCCTNLEEVEFIGSPSYISGFDYCRNLKEITLPSSCIELGDYAFYYASGLENITLNEGLLYIGQCCFTNTVITSLNLPESLLALGNNDYIAMNPNNPYQTQPSNFMNVKMNFLYIPQNVCKLGASLFYQAEIKNIVLPKSVKEIGQLTFNQYYLSSPSTKEKAPNIFYLGTKEEFNEINIMVYSTTIFPRPIMEYLGNSIIGFMYYYSETTPIDMDNNYWHYVDGEIVIWE